MSHQIRIDLDGGKYTYIFNNGKQHALRHGERWRDLVGDKFVYAMACQIEELQDNAAEQKRLEAQLSKALGYDATNPSMCDLVVEAGLLARERAAMAARLENMKAEWEKNDASKVSATSKLELIVELLYVKPVASLTRQDQSGGPDDGQNR